MPTAIPSARRVDPTVSARSAGLKYATDTMPGIQRVGNGSGFKYLDAAGEVVRDSATLTRIKAAQSKRKAR